MILDAVLASFHHIALALIIAMLGAQLGFSKLAGKAASVDLFTTLKRINALYLGSLGLMAFAGFVRLFEGVKSLDFYLSSHSFRTKTVLFAVLVAVALLNTSKSATWIVTAPDAQSLGQFRRNLMIQKTILVLMLVCAAFMARGY